uniref:ATP synthase complex subunit 8 n=1 Tax=Barynotus obscurus TaxID=1069882 RepID=J9PIR1_9CUCU|nr:ATP synthase F0 subunit 8 [Barynotus obscurus]
MPQMAPINWLTLYFLFITMLIIIIILNYFCFHYPPKSTKKSKIMNFISWKW